LNAPAEEEEEEEGRRRRRRRWRRRRSRRGRGRRRRRRRRRKRRSSRRRRRKRRFNVGGVLVLNTPPAVLGVGLAHVEELNVGGVAFHVVAEQLQVEVEVLLVERQASGSL